MVSRGRRWLPALLLVILSGCADEETSVEETDPPVPYDGAIMGESVDRRPIVVERFGATGPVVLLFHTIHGDERPAQQCAERMRSWLLGHPEAYQDLQVAFISQANPDGYLAQTRHNANGIDLNRNFPASNFEPSDRFGPSPASEPETRVLVELVEEASPVTIVSVHSPLVVINYDGPAGELAEMASEATGIPVDLDVGTYPGSFGSYAGVDLQIPTITLEAPEVLLSREDHQPWIQVEELTLQWVAERALAPGPSLAELVTGEDDTEEYEPIHLGNSAGGRPLIAERFGDVGDPILVVAGLDGSDMAVHGAERLRAKLMGRLGQAAGQRTVLLLTMANPDGVLAQQPSDASGLQPDKSFAAGFVPGNGAGAQPFECVEAAAIRTLVEDRTIGAVVVIQDGGALPRMGVDGSAEAMWQAADGSLLDAYEPLETGRPGSLAAWVAERGIPALTIAVPSQPEEIDSVRADNLGSALIDVVEAAP